MNSTEPSREFTDTVQMSGRPLGISLHVYPTTFLHESRILKETSVLGAAGIFEHVWIAALGAESLALTESIDSRRTLERFRLSSNQLPKFLARTLKLPEWYLRVFNRFRRKDVRVVSCHSLSSLPLGLLFKFGCRSKLVYETHELETHRNGWSPLTVKIAGIAEQLMFRFVDHTVTVGDSIGMWYRSNYRTDKVAVVKNIPEQCKAPAKSKDYFRTHFGIQPESIIFLYQGVLSRGRSIETLLELFKQMPSDKHLVLMGYGPLTDKIKQAAIENEQIHYHPAVPPDELLSYTAAADVGLTLFENTSLSYFYSAPNKLFEYLICGIPMIVSDFPDMAAVVNRHGCGWKVPVDPVAIGALINSISSREIAEQKSRVRLASQQISWETEAKTLLEVYRAVTSN